MTGHDIVTPGADIRERTAYAVGDATLQQALRNLDRRLHTAAAVEDAHPDWKDAAAAIRRETLADLDGWIDKLEASLTALGVHVHRAATPADARDIILGIARRHGATRIAKSKSMATEEIDLASALEADGRSAVETDLGEYIVQLAHERPSHMITPAIHKTLPQIRAILSAEAGTELPLSREELTAWARARLREEFLISDLGVTGVNFAAADTGTLVLVTNEGNGRFCTTLPDVHVAVMPIEKVVPRFRDLGVLLPLLTSSATGQRLSNYVQMITGPRRADEVDGPSELHVVILDNNRRALLGTPYEDMLACIRCGACLNVCPVYRHVGGHAYDSVYSGPMGKVLTPLLSAGAEGRDLPFGSTLCGACTEACPVQIPLADLLVRLRADLRTPGPFRPAPASPVPPAPTTHARRPGEGFASPRADAPLPVTPSRTRRVRRIGFDVWSRVGNTAWVPPHDRAGAYRRARHPPAGLDRPRDAPMDRRARPPGARGEVLPVAMALDLSARLRENACVVHEVDRATAPATIVARVAEHAREGAVAVAPADPLIGELALIPALREHGLTLLLPDAPDWRDALPNATVGLTGAALAVTEPAAIALVAGPHVPRATSLLPPVHICVLRASDIVPAFADAVSSFAGTLPSALTWIGGPSRTGDLEMITTLGVHGPTIVEVVIVGD